MKRLLFILAFTPFLLNAQTPAALIDLSKYHDDARIMEMVDENFSDITDGTYAIPALTVTGVITANGGIKQTPTVTEYTIIVVIDSTKISGDDAGDIGHADGAILVAQPGTGFTLEFISAFMIYDRVTADFAGGSNDAVFQVGVTGTQVSVSSAITDASLLTASTDKMLSLRSIATELVHADNGAISLTASEYTNNAGTAAGFLTVHLKYRIHTTGL